MSATVSGHATPPSSLWQHRPRADVCAYRFAHALTCPLRYHNCATAPPPLHHRPSRIPPDRTIRNTAAHPGSPFPIAQKIPALLGHPAVSSLPVCSTPARTSRRARRSQRTTWADVEQTLRKARIGLPERFLSEPAHSIHSSCSSRYANYQLIIHRLLAATPRPFDVFDITALIMGTGWELVCLQLLRFRPVPATEKQGSQPNSAQQKRQVQMRNG